MKEAKRIWSSPLVERNASPEMAALFGGHHRVLTWRRIWLALGKRDFVMRFRRMRLGIAWQLISLTLLLLTIGFIYARLFHQDVREFLVFLAASLILWFYLTQAMDTGCTALVASEGYIKQLPMPPLTYAFRAFTATTLSFFLSVPAFFAVKLVFMRVFWWGMLWAIPGLVLFALVAALHGAILAYLNARIRDFQPAVSAMMQILFYVSTVIIMPKQLPEVMYRYNPQYHLLNIVRGPLLDRTLPPLYSYAWTLGFILVLFLGL
jgi:ABC-type polysaccharide/polyol phosphate export permease